jgi:hypothetical protein
MYNLLLLVMKISPPNCNFPFIYSYEKCIHMLSVIKAHLFFIVFLLTCCLIRVHQKKMIRETKNDPAHTSSIQKTFRQFFRYYCYWLSVSCFL